MLADPQSVTLSGSAVSLPRTSVTPNGAVYTSPDSTIRLDVVHNVGRRNRTTLRLRVDKIAADPLLASVNRRLSMTAYIGIDVPPEGFVIADQVAALKAACDWLSASTYANATKLVGGES